MGTILLVGLSLSQPAVTSAHSTAVQSVSSSARQAIAADKVSRPCDPQNASSHCLIPTHYDNLCGEQQQWYIATSHDGHNIGWTYTYGSQHCLTVTWDLSNLPNLQACSAWMYIPAGDSTAVVQYETNNGKSASTVDQSAYGNNNIGEFVQIFSPGQFGNNIQLTDQTSSASEGYHAAQIGWGTEAAYSLDLECPLSPIDPGKPGQPGKPTQIA